MRAEPVVALDAFASDALLAAAPLEVSATARMVVALVSVQFSGPAVRPATLACNGRQGINQRVEHDRVVTIGPRDAEHQRDL
jgi:anaerobic selenocysteine-containing dehydrogenase